MTSSKNNSRTASINQETEVISQRSRKESTSDDNEKPDGGWGWVILLSAFLISFILDGIMYSFGKRPFLFAKELINKCFYRNKRYHIG